MYFFLLLQSFPKGDFWGFWKLWNRLFSGFSIVGICPLKELQYLGVYFIFDPLTKDIHFFFLVVKSLQHVSRLLVFVLNSHGPSD